MTVTVKLKPSVASVVAVVLLDQETRDWPHLMYEGFNHDQLERMRRELLKLGSYIASHAPPLPTEPEPLPSNHPINLPIA